MDEVNDEFQSAIEKIKSIQKKGKQGNKDSSNNQIKEELNKKERVLNRMKKDLKTSDSKLKVSEEKQRKLEDENAKLKNKLDKKEKQLDYMSIEKDDYEERYNEIKEDLNKNKDLYAKAVKVEELEGKLEIKDKEIDGLIKENNQKIRDKNHIIKKKDKRIARDNYKGKQYEAAEKNRRKMQSELSKFKNKYNELVNQMKKEKNEQTDKIIECQRKVKHLKDNKEEILKELIKDLNENTIKHYNRVVKLNKKYNNLKNKLNKTEKEEEIELGYIVHKENDVYFKSSEEEGELKEIHYEKGKQYKNGSVCTVQILDDNKVRVKRFHRTNDRNQETLETKIKSRKDKDSNDTNEIQVNNELLLEIQKYNTVILTSRNVKSYNNYFNEYKTVNVIDPFSDGERKTSRAIDNADIVVIRPDGTPHKTTDYAKRYYKDKTIFAYNAGRLEVSNAIYGKAKQLTEESK